MLYKVLSIGKVSREFNVSNEYKLKDLFNLSGRFYIYLDFGLSYNIKTSIFPLYEQDKEQIVLKNLYSIRPNFNLLISEDFGADFGILRKDGVYSFFSEDVLKTYFKLSKL